MCNNHSHKPQSSKEQHLSEQGRLGEALEHGAAHAEDHALWTRRDFLTRVGAASLGATMMMGGMPVQAFGGNRLLDALSLLNTDRVLVLIQLSGGNDGLNTIIPVTSDDYYKKRPTLGIKAANALRLSDDYYMHKALANVQASWGNGEMAVMHNVGYPSPNLSHFRSTDIWLTGSGSTDYLTTGWLGRALENDYPNYDKNPTPNPLAIKIGTTASLLFQGPDTSMGLAVSNPEEFARIVGTGKLYDENQVPATQYGNQLGFVRNIANASFKYAGVMKDANTKGKNIGTYPTTTLAQSLAIVSRLIKGGLGSKIYTVSIGGFDTHTNQLNSHTTLYTQIADAMKAFLADLNAEGWGNKVMTMTFSEFGRRVVENSSGGTDHGTSSPMLMFGKGLNGGFYGAGPNLTSLDSSGNLKHSIDFRAIYATLMQDWFGMKSADVATILGQKFDPLKFVASPLTPTGVSNEPLPTNFQLAQNYPNPFNPSTVISYSLDQPSKIAVKVYDTAGRVVANLVDMVQSAGNYELTFNAEHLPSGVYIYRLETPQGSLAKKMTLIR